MFRPVRTTAQARQGLLSVEAAGNNEPPSRTNGLQVRREAQDFRRGDVKADALMTVSK